MPKAILEKQFLQEFRKLSPVGRGEVFKYTRWLLDLEGHERLARANDDESEDQVSDSYERTQNKSRLP